MDNTYRILPPGYDRKKELTTALIYIGAASVLFIFAWIIVISNANYKMYDRSGMTVIEIPGAIFPYCSSLFYPGIYAFVLAAVGFAALAVRYYTYHFRGGSRSIYTMRRLAGRFELLRRCCTIPALGILACVIVSRLLALLLGGIYLLAVPDRWMPAGAWADILSFVTFGGF